MAGPHEIRIYGDPVLKTPCMEITEIDGTIAQLAKDMIETMYASRGVGVAANQVGVSKAMFVYDDGHGANTLINPKIIETSDEWEYEEGCLSVPGLFFPIVRPGKVTLEALDLDGNQVRHEVNELTGRIFQHEVDHLHGMLLLSRLNPEQKRTAMRTLRERDIKADK